MRELVLCCNHNLGATHPSIHLSIFFIHPFHHSIIFLLISPTGHELQDELRKAAPKTGIRLDLRWMQLDRFCDTWYVIMCVLSHMCQSSTHQSFHVNEHFLNLNGNEALINLFPELTLQPNTRCKWAGEQFIIFNPSSYFGGNRVCWTMKYLLAPQTKDVVIDRIIFKQSQ